MFLEILLASKTAAGVSLAGRLWTEQLLASAAVHLVHFALVTKQTTAIGETEELRTLLAVTAIWAFVFIHVLASGMSALF